MSMLGSSSPERVVVDGGGHYFALLVRRSLCYAAACDRAFPKRLAFAFLDEIMKEFDTVHAREVAAASKPFAFMQFGV